MWSISLLFITHQLTWSSASVRIARGSGTLQTVCTLIKQHGNSLDSSIAAPWTEKMQRNYKCITSLLIVLRSTALIDFDFIIGFCDNYLFAWAWLWSVEELEILLSCVLQITFLHHYKVLMYLPPSKTGYPLR